LRWPVVKVKTVCEQIRGITYGKSQISDEPKQSYETLYRSNNISPEGTLNELKLTYVNSDCVKEKQLLKVFDVLVTASTGSKSAIGKNAQLLKPKRITFGAFCKVLRPNQEIVDPLYFGFFFKRDEYRSYISNVVEGANINNLKNAHIDDMEILLPPLPVQKQVAAVLEKADTLRQQCQQMEQELNALAQSVFLDMFGEPVTNPKGWPILRFKNIGRSQLGKMLSAKSKQGVNPKLYLRNANIRWRNIELHDLLKMDFSDKEMEKFTLENGDLLVCEGGEVGRCAIWRNQLSDCYYQKALHRVRLNTKIALPEYIQEYFYWMSRLGGLASSTSEVTFSHLTAAKLAELKVPIPPINLQVKFSKKMERINSQINQIKIEKRVFENMFNALMQRAFKGELELKDVA
jgi:type I restriction enzyme S subunit